MTARASQATDGRTARAERNASAIVDALLSFYRRGEYTPTVEQIAERAGLTRRSVYNRFGDAEQVALELARRQLAEHGPLYAAAPRPEAPRAQRIAQLVEQRVALYEAIAPVRRAALANAHRSPTIRRQMRELSRFGRSLVEQTFQCELAALPPARRQTALELLDLLCSFEAWDRLRQVQRMGADAAREAMERAVRGALEG